MRGIRKFFLGAAAAAAAAFGLVSCEQIPEIDPGPAVVAKYDYNGTKLPGPGAGTVKFFDDNTCSIEFVAQSMTIKKFTGTYTVGPKDGAAVDIDWTKIYMPDNTGGLQDVSEAAAYKIFLKKYMYKISGGKIAEVVPEPETPNPSTGTQNPGGGSGETPGSGSSDSQTPPADSGGGNPPQNPSPTTPTDPAPTPEPEKPAPPQEPGEDLSGYVFNFEGKEYKLTSSGGSFEITAGATYQFNLYNPDTDKWYHYSKMDFEVEEGIEVLYPQNKNSGSTILKGLEHGVPYTVSLKSRAGQKTLCTVRKSGTSNPVYPQEPVQQVVLLKDFYLRDENPMNYERAEYQLGESGTVTITADSTIYKFNLYNPVADEWWTSFGIDFKAEKGISIDYDGGITTLSGLQQGKPYTVKFTLSSDGSKFTCAIGDNPRSVEPVEKDLQGYYLWSAENSWKSDEKFKLGEKGEVEITATSSSYRFTLYNPGSKKFRSPGTFEAESGISISIEGIDICLEGLTPGKYTVKFSLDSDGKIRCAIGNNPSPTTPIPPSIQQDKLPEYYLCSKETKRYVYNSNTGKEELTTWQPVKEFQLGDDRTVTITANAETLENGDYVFKLRRTLGGDGVDGDSGDDWKGYDYLDFALPGGITAAAGGYNNVVLSGLTQGSKYALRFESRGQGQKVLCTVTDAGSAD